MHFFSYICGAILNIIRQSLRYHKGTRNQTIISKHQFKCGYNYYNIFVQVVKIHQLHFVYLQNFVSFKINQHSYILIVFTNIRIRKNIIQQSSFN